MKKLQLLRATFGSVRIWSHSSVEWVEPLKNLNYWRSCVTFESLLQFGVSVGVLMARCVQIRFSGAKILRLYEWLFSRHHCSVVTVSALTWHEISFQWSAHSTLNLEQPPVLCSCLIPVSFALRDWLPRCYLAASTLVVFPSWWGLNRTSLLHLDFSCLCFPARLTSAYSWIFPRLVLKYCGFRHDSPY